MGKYSSHYIAQYITFTGYSLSNDCIHRVYMQDFYRCHEGYEAKAASISEEATKKLVQAIIDYYAHTEG